MLALYAEYKLDGIYSGGGRLTRWLTAMSAAVAMDLAELPTATHGKV